MIVQRQSAVGDDGPVSEAIEGDRAAISALWQRHRRWIAAVLLAHKPAEADLEDLLQEVAIRMVGRLDTVREEGNVRAWLRAVAVNVARSAARRRPLPAIDVDGACAPSAQAPPGQLAEGWLVEALAELPELYREPLILRAVHGLRSKQVAAILGVPPATIDTRVARARRMLRERWPDERRPVATDRQRGATAQETNHGR